MADETEIEPYEWSLADSLTNHSKILVSGGVAGCVAKTVTAPLSRITILFQVRAFGGAFEMCWGKSLCVFCVISCLCAKPRVFLRVKLAWCCGVLNAMCLCL